MPSVWNQSYLQQQEEEDFVTQELPYQMCSLGAYCPSYRGRESLSGRGATEVGEARPVTGGGGRIAMATDETMLGAAKTFSWNNNNTSY